MEKLTIDNIKTRQQAIRFLQEQSLSYTGEYLFAFKGTKLTMKMWSEGERIGVSDDMDASSKLEGADVFHSHPAQKLAVKVAVLSYVDIESCIYWHCSSCTAIVGRHAATFFNRGQLTLPQLHNRHDHYAIPPMERRGASIAETLAATESLKISGVVHFILDK